MYILEANGEGLIEIALENGVEIQINVFDLGEGKANIIVCADDSVLLSLEHLKCDPRELLHK